MLTWRADRYHARWNSRRVEFGVMFEATCAAQQFVIACGLFGCASLETFSPPADLFPLAAGMFCMIWALDLALDAIALKRDEAILAQAFEDGLKALSSDADFRDYPSARHLDAWFEGFGITYAAMNAEADR